MAPAISELHAGVSEQFVATAVLLSWCAYAPDESKPKTECINELNNCALVAGRSEKEADPNVIAHANRLHSPVSIE